MDNMTVAKTIIEQLGGKRFAGMTGARNFRTIEQGVLFTLPSRVAKNGINTVRIILDPNDTYTVKFMRLWGNKIKEVSSCSDVYCDGLAPLFESETGLYTRL